MKHLIRLFIAVFAVLICTVSVSAQSLHGACWNGDLKTVKKLIESDPGKVNSKNAAGRIPLGLAAHKGHTEIVKYLISRGADVNQKNRLGGTPLHYASFWSGSMEVVKILIKNGAEINVKENTGATPLDFAINGKQKEIAEHLLEQGGKFDMENTGKKYLRPHTHAHSRISRKHKNVRSAFSRKSGY